MASALPVARAQLKDLKPPISDAAIQDSLWHYWFDVDKTVAWLRKDWEKKGTFGVILPLPPSPSLESTTALASRLVARAQVSVPG
jgi:elongation factor 1 alpha-like protein